MRRPTAVSLSAALAALLLCAGLWLTSGRAVSAQAPERTPIASTPSAPAATVGAIALHAPGAPATAWTVVQWGDPLGGWHDVEGWRGDLDEGQQKVWWVVGKDFGTGPFRWVVYHQAGGKVWATSRSFTLPAGAGQWVHVNVAP
jgi:hypothetical protein